MLIVTNS